MEPAKGFKGILLDVLGLKPDGASPPVADSADAAAPSAGDLLLPQHAAAEPDDVAEKSTRAHIDEQDEMFAARLLTISQRVGLLQAECIVLCRHVHAVLGAMLQRL